MAVAGFMITDIERGKTVTREFPEDVYSRLHNVIGVEHEVAADVETWCQTASIGEMYEEFDFTVEVIEL